MTSTYSHGASEPEGISKLYLRCLFKSIVPMASVDEASPGFDEKGEQLGFGCPLATQARV